MVQMEEEGVVSCIGVDGLGWRVGAGFGLVVVTTSGMVDSA